MFAGQTNQLPYVRNYHEAQKFFNETKKPPRSKKWDEHQRPLKNTSSYHYRIEKRTHSGRECYDLVLYSTVMARFHKPDANNIERRQYKGHYSQTSKGFMWDVLGVRVFDQQTTTEGTDVVAPIYDKTLPGSEFSADYFFDVSESHTGRLITSMSQHTRHYKKISSSADKAERKIVREKLEPLLTMAAMRMPEYADNCEMTYFMGQPFGGTNINGAHRMAAKALCDALLKNEQGSAGDYDLFFSAGQCVFDKLASVRAYEQGTVRQWGKSALYDELYQEYRITERQFMQSMWRFVHDAAGLAKRTGAVEYPQFCDPHDMTFSNVTLYP